MNKVEKFCQETLLLRVRKNLRPEARAFTEYIITLWAGSCESVLENRPLIGWHIASSPIRCLVSKTHNVSKTLVYMIWPYICRLFKICFAQHKNKSRPDTQDCPRLSAWLSRIRKTTQVIGLLKSDTKKINKYGPNRSLHRIQISIKT